MLRILQESETSDFSGTATGDESWFQHTMASSKIFAPSAADVIPRTRQTVGAKNMIMVLFTTKKFIDVLPRGGTLNQLYSINDTFLDLKTANVIVRRQKTGSTFGCPWIIPSAIRDRRLRQKNKRTTFPECRTHYSLNISACNF
jgi:hypothetical protein